MRFRTFSMCALVCVCWLSVAGNFSTFAATQDNKQSDAKLTSGEREAADKINKAKGGEAKSTSVEEFGGNYTKL